MSRSTKSHHSPGEGTIVQRADGRWQASLQVDGKRRHVYARTRKEAAAKLSNLQQQAALVGDLPDPGKRTVGDLLDAWLDTVSPSLKPNTVAQYSLVCNKHIRAGLGAVRLADLSPRRVQAFYAPLQSSGRTRTAELAHFLLKQALAMAVMWGWLGSNPSERVIPPAHRTQRKEMWSLEQLERFLAGTEGGWLHPLWCLAVCSGCRLGELLALTWADADLVTGMLQVQKSLQRAGGQWLIGTLKTDGSYRAMSLPARALRALAQQREQQGEWRLACDGNWTEWDLVFTTGQGGPIHRATVAHAMRRACDRLGLPRLSPHGLRHLHASILLNEGVSVPIVSERLGHANPGITMSVYAHALMATDGLAARALDTAFGGESS